MLISAVLRILDQNDPSARGSAVKAAEPFSAYLSSQGFGEAAPPIPEAHSQGSSPIGPDNASSPKSGNELFPLGQRTYDSFVRALKDSKTRRTAHRLDIFR